ncbi:MAG: Lrp/AsnC family transcriptional regulator [Flavobacteriaceae bacterium]
MRINNNNLEIDGIDKIIIRSLKENARVSVTEISKSAGISGAAVHQRIRKLEQFGFFKGSQMIVDPSVLGYKTLAFVGIYLDKASNNKNTVLLLKKIPEVLECHYTTGDWSIFIKLQCRDNKHLMELLNSSIQTIPGVSRTETFISLEEQIHRQMDF